MSMWFAERTIFSRVKIVLGKISRTLPRNFNALLTTSPHHIFSDVKNLGPFIDRVSEWL